MGRGEVANNCADYDCIETEGDVETAVMRRHHCKDLRGMRSRRGHAALEAHSRRARVEPAVSAVTRAAMWIKSHFHFARLRHIIF